MKKIFRLLLILTLALSIVMLVSCKKDKKDPSNGGTYIPDFEGGVEGPLIPYN